MPVPTAAEIAARTPTPVAHTQPTSLGSYEGHQVMVGAAALAKNLRDLVTCDADIRPTTGWWTLKAFGGLLSAGGVDPDELAVVAVNELRRLVDAEDPRGLSTAPLAWLVRLSTDTELRAWLHIPAARH